MDEDSVQPDAPAPDHAHPHVRLRQILTDLSTPRVDLHDKIGAVHRNLVALTQTVLEHTPPPEGS